MDLDDVGRMFGGRRNSDQAPVVKKKDYVAGIDAIIATSFNGPTKFKPRRNVALEEALAQTIRRAAFGMPVCHVRG